MPDGNALVKPSIRIARPLLEDYGHIARHMRPDEIDQFLAFSGFESYDPDEFARLMIRQNSDDYALIDAGNLPVFIGGLVPVRPGVWSVWAMGTMDGWAKYWRAITKLCRRLIDDKMKASHRVQICALVSRTQAHEWYVRSLKMEPEGIQHRFCVDGQDAAMFARYK